MEEFYQKILKKPKAYRRKLAYILTVIFGLLLFSLWMFISIDGLKKDMGDIQPNIDLQNNTPSLKKMYQEQDNENQEIKKELEELGY